MTVNGTDELVKALQDDAGKLPRLTVGNKELDAVAQIVIRTAATLADLARRVELLEAERIRTDPTPKA